MNKHIREAILQRLSEHIPDPKTELVYHSPFELLIAVMLSAQATDVSVNKATPALFAKANTAPTMAQLSLDEIEAAIKTIGLYRTKAKNVQQTAQLLTERYQGEVPCDFNALIALPGVGRKTANVILNTAFGLPTIAVDTHIFRVCNRTGFAPGKTVDIVEEKLQKVVPNRYKIDCHHLFILHGRYTCVARKPRCGSCVIEDLCEFKEKIELE